MSFFTYVMLSVSMMSELWYDQPERFVQKLPHGTKRHCLFIGLIDLPSFCRLVPTMELVSDICSVLNLTAYRIKEKCMNGYRSPHLVRRVCVLISTEFWNTAFHIS